jgi:phosphate transport system protein
MSIQTDVTENQHTLKSFDSELAHLQGLLLEMGATIALQIDQLLQALNDGDLDGAEKVVFRDHEVNKLEVDIDAEVLSILARHNPVANDLRGLISTSKIAEELEGIGDELTECAKLVMVLFDPRTSDPNPRLLTDLVKIGNLVRHMLGKLQQLIENRDLDQAYSLLQYDRDCETELKNGIEHQLDYVVKDARLIGRSLDIMHIMKSLERCGEYCRSIAEHMIYMIDGVDVRHTGMA